MCRRRRRRALAGLQLEKVCGRAALLAGDVEGYAGACFGLELEGRVTDDLRKGQRCSLEGQVMVLDWRDCCRAGGAALRDGRKADPGIGGICRMRRSRAVMRAVPSAAGRKIRFGTGREGEHRRDQREAEDEKQHEAENTSHSVIVTSFAGGRVRDLLSAGWVN